MVTVLSGFSDLSGTLRHQYYADGIDLPAEDVGGLGGDVVPEEGGLYSYEVNGCEDHSLCNIQYDVEQDHGQKGSPDFPGG